MLAGTCRHSGGALNTLEMHDKSRYRMSEIAALKLGHCIMVVAQANRRQESISLASLWREYLFHLPFPMPRSIAGNRSDENPELSFLTLALLWFALTGLFVGNRVYDFSIYILKRLTAGNHWYLNCHCRQLYCAVVLKMYTFNVTASYCPVEFLYFIFSCASFVYCLRLTWMNELGSKQASIEWCLMNLLKMWINEAI